MLEPSTLSFTETHEWIHVEDNAIRVGITDYWQMRLSSITHVELPEPDDHHYEPHEDMGVVESLEMAADFHAPVAGVITAINTELLSKPELVNDDPYGDGWLVQMKPDDMSELEDLLDFSEYEAGIPDEEEEEE